MLLQQGICQEEKNVLFDGLAISLYRFDCPNLKNKQMSKKCLEEYCKISTAKKVYIKH